MCFFAASEFHSHKFSVRCFVDDENLRQVSGSQKVHVKVVKNFDGERFVELTVG